MWASSDQGRSWQLVSGLNNGRTTYPGADFPGYTVDSQSRLFVVAGTRPGQGATGHVWMSTNGGVSWTQQLNSSAATGLPPRSFPDLYVDSTDALYAIAGLMPDGSNDVWRSSDQGRNWYKQTSMPFPTPPGRSSGALLHFPSTQLSQSGLDVLTYMGGYGRPPITYYNDVSPSLPLLLSSSSLPHRPRPLHSPLQPSAHSPLCCSRPLCRSTSAPTEARSG